MWFLSGNDGSWGGQALGSERLHAQVQQGQSQHYRPEPPEWWSPQWSHWSRYTGHHWPTGGPDQAKARIWRQERWVTNFLRSFLLLLQLKIYTLLMSLVHHLKLYFFVCLQTSSLLPLVYCLGLKQLISVWSYNHSLWLTLWLGFVWLDQRIHDKWQIWCG